MTFQECPAGDTAKAAPLSLRCDSFCRADTPSCNRCERASPRGHWGHLIHVNCVLIWAMFPSESGHRSGKLHPLPFRMALRVRVKSGIDFWRILTASYKVNDYAFRVLWQLSEHNLLCKGWSIQWNTALGFACVYQTLYELFPCCLLICLVNVYS